MSRWKVPRVGFYGGVYYDFDETTIGGFYI